MAHIRWDPDTIVSPLLEGDGQQDGTRQPEDRRTPKVETQMDSKETQAEHSTYLDLGIGAEGHMVSTKLLPLNSNKNIAV